MPTSIHIGAKTNQVKDLQPRAKRKDINLLTEVNEYLAKMTPVKTSDKVSFFRLLATMINAGISIVKALYILEEQTENPKFKIITREIAHSIETGSSFSEALSDHSKYFSESQVGMVEAGEASGRLNETLLEIAAETEKTASLMSKIKGAMIYPVVVISIMMIAGFVVMTFVMPKIKEMFEGLGGELPAMTQTLITVSDFMAGQTAGLPNSFLIAITILGGVAGFLWWKKTPLGRHIWSTIVLRIPIFGKLSQKVALARFCRSLSTLNSSGISILKALRISADSVGNAVYKKRIHLIADDVKQGITMGENMEDEKNLFPAMLVGMVSVAEQTAQIDKITGKLADYYEEEVDDMVKGLSALMEPIIIVILGLSVGFLVIAVMLPILEASDLAAMG